MSVPMTCPRCRAEFQREEIPVADRASFDGETHFSRVIGIYNHAADSTVAWKCPDCQHEWPVAGDLGFGLRTFELMTRFHVSDATRVPATPSDAAPARVIPSDEEIRAALKRDRPNLVVGILALLGVLLCAGVGTVIGFILFEAAGGLDNPQAAINPRGRFMLVPAGTLLGLGVGVGAYYLLGKLFRRRRP